MTSIQTQIDKLVKLFQARKIKDAKIYIDKIDVDVPDTVNEQIIAKSLQKCLVQLKTTPLGVMSALYFYKQLLIRSLFDFMESQIFNQKIHKFLYDACLYNCKAPLDQRGNKYFKQKLNVTGDKTQVYGNTVITLALEIVQAMNSWYPVSYYDESQPSIYAQMYKKLKQKGVVFPTETQYAFMKLQQKNKFKQSYLKWQQRMQKLQTQQLQAQNLNNKDKNKLNQQQIKKETKLDAKKSQKQLNPVPNEFIKIKSENLQSKIPNQQLKKTKQLTQQQPKISTTKISQLKQQQSKKLQKDKTVDQSSLNKNKQSQVKEQNPVFILQDPNKKVNQSKANLGKDEKQPPKQNIQPKKQINKSIVNKQTPPTFILEQKKQINSKTNIQQVPSVPPVPQKSSRQTKQQKVIVPPKLKAESLSSQIKQNKQAYRQTSRQKQEDKSQQHSRVQRKQQVPYKPPNQSISPHQTFSQQQLKKLNSHRLRQQEQHLRKIAEEAEKNNQRKSRQKSIVQDAKSTNQIDINSIERNPIQQQIKQNSRKVFRTQKPSVGDKRQRQQNHNINRQKKSLPKTQKIHFGTSYPFGVQFANLSPQKKQKFLSTNSEFQTLSDLRKFKTKNKIGFAQNQSVTSQSILSIIQKSRLGEVTIPFLPQYFEPVDIKMQALTLQSLRVGINSTLQPSKPFYKNQKIAVRVIKSHGSYILSLHNIGYSPISIAYSQALQAKHGNSFSCQAKVKGFQRKRMQDLIYWKADPNDFVDIPFQFHTCDPNFKFLQFVLAIQNKIVNLHLPITLLDQGIIQKRLYLQDISNFINLYGRILKSQPINLSLTDAHQHFTNLPQFFYKFKNKDSKILGYFTYNLEIDSQKFVKISVMVKKSMQISQKYQICALYDNRNQSNQDFAKVLIELLCFLLSKHH